MPVTLGARGRPLRHVFAREFDGELVLLDLAKGDYYGLDTIGAQLWQGLVGGGTIEEIAAALVKRYDVSLETLSLDLIALTQELVDRGLLEIEEGR
jgi:hypothetical protein